MSKTNSNLDLTQIDSSELDELAKRIEDFYKADSGTKSALSYHWERNHLFLDGKQWIVYDGERGRGGQWKTLQVSKSNEYIPRPVTNYIFDIYQTLKAYLVQHRPRTTVTPNSQTYRDKMGAKLANLCADANWERLCEEKNYEYAASCALPYGTVFKKDYWDLSSLTIAKVPRVAEQPTFDPMTGAVTGYEQKEVVDPNTGETLYDEIPLGDVNSCVVEPQRISLDPLASDLHNCRWIMEAAIQPLDWIREQFDRQDEGYTGRVDEVKSETSLSNSMRRFYQLKNSSGTKDGLGNAANASGSGGQDEMVENAAVVKEYYERPSLKYPKGRLVVVANGIPLYAGDSPYTGPELGDWHPYSEFRWEIVPGRFWGKGPLDDAVEIQKHINSIDAALILVRKTMAIPQKLIPNDSGIKPGEWTGRPGQEVRYRTSGAPPSTIPAAGVDQQVFQERQQRLEDMKQITGAVDILKGDRPPGVTAASALEMLFEVGTGKLKPALDRWKMFIESSQKKQLKLICQKYREPRPEFIRMLHNKNKEIPAEAIDRFIGSDLYDNCNVVIEAGSNIPKLQSAEKSLLLQLAQVGSLNLEAPQNKMEFNRRMGIVGFDNEVGPDIKRAEWENDLLENIEHSIGNKPVVLADEQHDVHKEVHMRRMKEPSFMSLSQAVQQAYMQHIAEHEQYIEKQKDMAMQEAMASGQPPQMPGPPQVGAKPHGKGIPAKLQGQVIAPDLPKGPVS